ncbi:MAG: serine/threonine protein kinase [Planctomycetes bacterium]|nr:serine/threonine protein kinase [Planctomycetota bacterium]
MAHPLAGSRWRIVERLGDGSEGVVCAVEDLVLDRVVAIKTLAHAHDPHAVTRFVGEARLAAALDHPNVPTVYDLAVGMDSSPSLVMKRISGLTLEAALRASTHSHRHKAIGSLNDVVTIFIGVGNAVAFAHTQRIRHHDIKPDNIVLGDFGQAYLTDWGAAGRGQAAAVALYGTPLYMSPEQARGEAVDDRSDQYALAASLFEATLLRSARPPGPPEELMERCRGGHLDEPTPKERATVPTQLLAIIMKGLGQRPEERYASVDLLIRDLSAFQAGLAISVYRDPLGAHVRRLLRHHGRAILATSASAIVITCLAWLLLAERIKERARWGPPVLVENFMGDGWRARWATMSGGFSQGSDAHGVVTTGSTRNVLALRRRLDGDTAIEYQAWYEDGAYPCDLSLMWRETPFVPGSWDDPQPTWCCAVGDYDGGNSAITLRPRGGYLDWSPFRPQPGAVHRVRVEIVGERMTLAVDGVVICTYAANVPFQGGYIALYGFYPGKRFDDVRIYALGVPERLPGTAYGDALLSAGHTAEAEAQYLRVATTHEGGPLADRARLRAGLCASADGRLKDARLDWSGITSPAERLRAGLLAAESGFIGGGPCGPALDAIAAAATDPSVRAAAALTWSACVRDILARRSIRQAEPFLTLRANVLTGEWGPRIAAAQALLALGRYTEVVNGFSDLDQLAAIALIRLGRGAEVLTRYPTQRLRGIEALAALGRWEEIPLRFCRGLATSETTKGFVEAGMPERRLEAEPEDVPALLALGRYVEAARVANSPELAARVAILSRMPFVVPKDLAPLLRMGLLMAGHRLDEALAYAPDCPQERCWPQALLGVRAAAAGKPSAALRAFAELTDNGMSDQRHATFAHFVIAPFVRQLHGETGALGQACARALSLDQGLDQQRPWYRAAYLTGRISHAAFLVKQPHRLFAPAEVTLLDAVLADGAGQKASAHALYGRYLDFPAFQRGFDIDPVLEEFAAWRRKATAKH